MLNIHKKTEKIYNSILNNPTEQLLLELKKIIISDNEIDYAFNYLKDFGIDDDIIYFLLNKVSYNELILKRLNDSLGIDVVINKLIGANDIKLILTYLNISDNVDNIYAITALEDHIVNSNNPLNMYSFAQGVKNSNKKRLAQGIIKTKNTMYIRKMAEAFPNLVELLTEGILETEDISEIIKFMLNVRGCPLGYMLKKLRIDDQGKIILVSELLRQDVIKYHFYADAIINKKNVVEQDKTYMQYCQSNDKSLEVILSQDLQLKNHAKIIKKVYKK